MHWLRRLIFRSAWLDQRVKEGELDVVFDEDTSGVHLHPARPGRRADRARSGAELEPRRVRAALALAARADHRRDLLVGGRGVVEQQLRDRHEPVAPRAQRADDFGRAATVSARLPPASCIRMIAPGRAPETAEWTIAATPGRR